MVKIAFIGAGSQFGATSFVDLMSFEELRNSEIVLVDINPDHLGPVAAYARKVLDPSPPPPPPPPASAPGSTSSSTPSAICSIPTTGRR